MQIQSITVQNFLGLREFAHKMQNPALLVAGPNGIGKSSLRDGILFALTGEYPRGVTKVAQRGDIVTEGAAAGFVEVALDGFRLRRSIGSGKLSDDSDMPEVPEAARYCLDPSLFASLADGERRKLLLGVTGVKVDAESVAKQMAGLDINEETINAVLPVLRSGFSAAATYAKEQASQHRGAWKAVTGEAYGSSKAETWKAKRPDENPLIADIEQARDLVARAEHAVLKATEAKGRLQSAVSAERRAELQALADAIPTLEADAEAKAEAFSEASSALEQIKAAAAAAQVHLVACPSCSAALVIDGDVLRVASDADKPRKTSNAKANGAEQVKATARREMLEADDRLKNAKAAEASLEYLPEPNPEDAELAANLEADRHYLDTRRLDLRNLEESARAYAAADKDTDRAKAAHVAVQQWTRAEAALGPDGIMATLLAKAVDPFNDALAIFAGLAGFAPARVERDLTLTYSGRPYALCSESEQWRADALFAAAIAVFSGVRFLVLDRLDVLDPESRAGCIDWIGQVSDQIDTTVILATLKAAPDLGDGFDVVWLGPSQE